ncbi:MAG: FAD-dependent oxidoreductase [Thermoproteota archaeon]|jgi:Dehydrogenases (flavoproteins)
MKIAIIGAGPAGANAAYWASKEGHHVEIYEKESILAKKPCGEAIFNEGFKFVYFKPEESKSILNYVDKVEVYYEDEFLIETETKPYFGYTVQKSFFLEEIMREAVQNGAKFYRKTFVEKFDTKKYDLVIDAAGYLSFLARREGLNYNGYKLAPAFRGYGRTDKIREDTLYISLFKLGYAWIFPYGKNKCNFGIGGHISNKKELETRLSRFLKKFEVETISKLEGAGFPALGPLDKLKIGNIVVAGDSAGMVMPISGEGIRFALFAGKYAFKENYEEIFNKTYYKKLKTGVKLLNFWFGMSKEELIKAIKTLDTRTLIEIFLEAKIPSIFKMLKLLKDINLSKKIINILSSK